MGAVEIDSGSQTTSDGPRIIRVDRTIQIDCPSSTVYASLTDTARWPMWSESVVAGEKVVAPRSGDTFRLPIRIAGKEIWLDWRVVEQEPPCIRYESAGEGVVLTVEETVDAVGDSTRLHVVCEYHLPLTLLRGLSPEYVRRLLLRETSCSLHNLRDLLEAECREGS